MHQMNMFQSKRTQELDKVTHCCGSCLTRIGRGSTDAIRRHMHNRNKPNSTIEILVHLTLKRINLRPRSGRCETTRTNTRGTLCPIGHVTLPLMPQLGLCRNVLRKRINHLRVLSWVYVVWWLPLSLNLGNSLSFSKTFNFINPLIPKQLTKITPTLFHG